MKYSNSMQYFPINKQIREINLYSYSQLSNHNANGYGPANTNFSKNIIQRNNSVTSLTDKIIILKIYSQQILKIKKQIIIGLYIVI